MTPNREQQWCCGGGGGIVAISEMDEFRLKSGARKVEQIRATGAKIVASPCENCRLQMEGLNETQDLGVRIAAIMDLVMECMDLPGRKQPATA
jgi:Fe-S oxidoreductase